MTGQVVDTKKYKYSRVKVRGPDGVARYTASNLDAVAKSMFGMTKRQMEQVARDNEINLREHFKTRNLGHVRMILGQSLRSKVRRKEPVRINGIVITKLSMKVGWPPGFKEERKGTHDKPVRGDTTPRK